MKTNKLLKRLGCGILVPGLATTALAVEFQKIESPGLVLVGQDDAGD